MTADGASKTKVTNARGETVMAKAEDVARMLRALNVNAANPSVVLSQDYSRGLLSGEHVERKLYKLLMDSLGFDTTATLLKAAKGLISTQQKEVRNWSCCAASNVSLVSVAGGLPISSRANLGAGAL